MYSIPWIVFLKWELAWLNLISENAVDTEELQDEPFVVCYSVYLGDEEELPVDHEKGDQFRFFYTTLALIKKSSHCKIVIQTDGTYKIVWQKDKLENKQAAKRAKLVTKAWFLLVLLQTNNFSFL